MAEKMIKNLLEKKLVLLKKLKGHLQKQNKAVGENDERLLAQILSAKEKVIESLIKDDQDLDRQVAVLDDKNRIAIANNLKEFEIQIERETEIIFEMENDCEKKLMNERFELFERMKSLKKGRTLLKGYGRSPRIKPKLKGSI
tara:strand:- start:32 stop:460 length:429 start_codon:yes stop_codon:yes gene_type:complete